MKRTSFLILCFSAHLSLAQENQPVPIIKTTEQFRKLIEKDPELAMINIANTVPFIKLDLKYSSKTNFTGKRMYPANTSSTYLRKEVTRALTAIAKELEQFGIGLLIWDAYRPYDVTVRFWKLIHDERYVAHPKNGSGHNRGIAVDLTLYNLADGKELKMPTGFDDFSEKAHHDFMQLEKEQINNRERLLRVMEKYGFRRYNTEWWHYSWPNPEKYPLLNLSFNQLNQLQ